MIALLGVAGAGAVGAPCRFLLDHWVSRRHRGAFPWGTLVINTSGSFVFGLIAGLALYQGLGHLPRTIIGTGFCGAYTTFSTFTFETFRLVEEGQRAAALRNVAGSLLAGLAAAAAGLALAYAV